jgi:phosphoribosylglycinamide formyltransferase-1
LSTDRLDLIVDLDNERIAWAPLHAGLEALDAAGFIPHRFHTIPERELARIDLDLGGALSPELFGGGGWIIERKGTPLVGCAGYRGEGEAGLAGPFLLSGVPAEHRATIWLGVLFSLQERGYRRARICGIAAAAALELAPLLAEAVIERHPWPMSRVPQIAVCASGNGSNLQALIDGQAEGRLAIELSRLVVNRANLPAARRAKAAGIPVTTVCWDRAGEDRASFDARVLDAVGAANPDIVLLLGWMHLLPPSFVAAFPRLYNIHPAYLPLRPEDDEVILPDGSRQAAFRGRRAVEDALAAGARWIGASVHRVTEAVDRGAIVARAPLFVEERAALDARLHALEHRVLIDAVDSIGAKQL